MTARSTKSVSLSLSLGVIMPQKLSPSPLSCTHTTIQSISALLTAYAPFYRFSHLILFLIRFPFLYILWSALSFEVVHDENIKKIKLFWLHFTMFSCRCCYPSRVSCLRIPTMWPISDLRCGTYKSWRICTAIILVPPTRREQTREFLFWVAFSTNA